MSNPITWRNVGRANNNAGVSLLNAATGDFNNAFKGVSAAINDLEQGHQAEYDYKVKTNTDQYLNHINSFKDVDAFNAAQQSGQFQNMLAGFDGDVNQELVRGADDRWLNQLQTRRTDEIAYATANANEDERLRNAAEKPYLAELNNLFEVDPEKARALADQYASDGTLLDVSKLKERWETESQDDKKWDQSQKQYDQSQEEWERKNDRALYETGRTARLEKKMADAARLAEQFNTDTADYVESNNLPTIGDVPGGAIDFNRMGKKAILAYQEWSRNQEQPQTMEEIIQAFNQGEIGQKGSRVEDYGAADNFIRGQLDSSLTEAETTKIKGDVSNYIRANNFLTLENNMMSYQNQSQYGGVNGLRDAEAAYQKLVDEDGDPDWDYDDWRPEILKAMTDGIRYDENDPSKVVKLPPFAIQSIIESAKKGKNENNDGFRTAANAYVAAQRPDELAKQAADIEAKSLALTAGATAKKGKNNPHYQAMQRGRNRDSAVVPEFTNEELRQQEQDARAEQLRLEEEARQRRLEELWEQEAQNIGGA